MKKDHTPLFLKPSITSNERTKASKVIKDMFKTCPVCGKYSFKPNYNMNLIPDPASLAAIVAMRGRRCKLCNFIVYPSVPIDLK
jgi:hypothetical protein